MGEHCILYRTRGNASAFPLILLYRKLLTVWWSPTRIFAENSCYGTNEVCALFYILGKFSVRGGQETYLFLIFPALWGGIRLILLFCTFLRLRSCTRHRYRIWSRINSSCNNNPYFCTFNQSAQTICIYFHRQGINPLF